MTEIVKAVLNANKEIYEYINNSLTAEDFGYSGIIGAGGDDSALMDMKAESIFVKHLLPYGDILSEESGYIASNSTFNIQHSTFIIDPIDGSDNFMARLPYFGSSVAYEVDGEIKLAAIGNFCNGECLIYDGYEKTIYNLTNDTKNEIFDVQNPKFGIFERSYQFPQICAKLTKLGIKFRSPGAVALTLANAHNCQFVLFGGKMRDYDLKAGLFLTQDLHRFENGKFLLIAKEEEIFSQLKEIIKEL